MSTCLFHSSLQDWSFQQTVCLPSSISSQHQTSASSLQCRSSRSDSSFTPKVSVRHPTHSMGGPLCSMGFTPNSAPTWVHIPDWGDSTPPICLCTAGSRTTNPCSAPSCSRLFVRVTLSCVILTCKAVVVQRKDFRAFYRSPETLT